MLSKITTRVFPASHTGLNHIQIYVFRNASVRYFTKYNQAYQGHHGSASKSNSSTTLRASLYPANMNLMALAGAGVLAIGTFYYYRSGLSSVDGTHEKSFSYSPREEPKTSNNIDRPVPSSLPQEEPNPTIKSNTHTYTDNQAPSSPLQEEPKTKLKEIEITHWMQLQLQAYLAHLNDCLKQQAEQHEGEMVKWETRVEELQTLMARDVPSRLLWLACLEVMDKMHHQPKEELDKSFETLRKLAPNDKLSLAVLEQLNKDIHGRSSLVQRFEKVERIARRVAMVGDKGTLLRYLSSYLQSLFVFNIDVPALELEGKMTVDPTKWTEYDKIARIRCCLRQNNLEQALRYANQLKGQSRFVAKDWILDLRSYLEARQALQVLATHAEVHTLRLLDIRDIQ